MAIVKHCCQARSVHSPLPCFTLCLQGWGGAEAACALDELLALLLGLLAPGLPESCAQLTAAPWDAPPTAQPSTSLPGAKQGPAAPAQLRLRVTTIPGKVEITGEVRGMAQSL